MKKLLVAYVLVGVLLVVQLIWSPIKSVSVVTSSANPTCKVRRGPCSNLVARYYRNGSKHDTKSDMYVYGGARAQWLKVQDLGGLHRKNRFLVLTLHGAARVGGAWIRTLHKEFVYGSLGKKGQFRIFSEDVKAPYKGSVGPWKDVPVKRKLKTVKGGKKHVLMLTRATVKLISPAFPVPQHSLPEE